jgi:hypothetical protein
MRNEYSTNTTLSSTTQSQHGTEACERYKVCWTLPSGNQDHLARQRSLTLSLLLKTDKQINVK